jgi:hypothetical protein
MLPDRNLDDLLAVMISRLEQAESRIAELERQETPSVIGTNTGDVTLAAPNHGLGLTGQVITLGTPSTLAVATTNAVVTTSHTHAITSSAAPGAAASILASTAAGLLTLQDLYTDVDVRVAGGLYVGSIATDPAAGTITALGSIIAKPITTAGIKLDPNAATGDFSLSLSPTNLTGNVRATFPDVNGSVAEGAGTLSISSTNNVATATHTHAVTSSSNPGVAASLLASDANGYLQLVRIGIGTVPGYPLHVVGAARIDGDLTFVGAQSILTTADSLTLAPAADLDLTPGGTARVRATSGVRLQSDNYVSQTTGWGISYLGSGDFRYLYADEMHVKAFIADLEQALAGGQIISKSVAPLAVDFVTPAAEATASLVVESFKGFDTFRVFVDGDMIRLRQFERGQTTTNLITNPSFEVDLTGWSTSGGARIVGYTRYGVAYLNAGSYTWIGATITNATQYSFSFYCKGDYNLNLDPGNGAYYSVAGYATPESDGWVRVTHTFTSNGTAFKVYFYNHNYDAIQLELGASASSYCDGSLGAGYHWTGTAHASTSYRGGTLDISNCWGTVVWVSTDTVAKTQTYTFTRSAVPNAGAVMTGAVIGAGTLALDYGTTGNGYLESNAMDGAQAEYAPYHQIVSWATHPNSGLTVRTRLGNLKGIFNTANEYGLYAGAGITDADQYLRISNEAVEGHNLPIKLYDGASVTMQLSPTAPSFAMGSTLPSAYGTGDGLWMGKDTAYKFRVGDVDGEMLAWDGTNLYVKADANNYLKTTGTTLQFWANAQLMLEIANTPAIALGLLSGPNVSITSAGMQIRNATTERIGMTSAGVLTISDSAGAAVITLDASAGAEITKKLTMPGANSAIAIGSTPPTSATVGTGLWLDRTGLYGLAANVLQAKMSATDGKIYAGAGAVRLDATGISVEITDTTTSLGSYKFLSGGVEKSGLCGYDVSNNNVILLRVPSEAGHHAHIYMYPTAPISEVASFEIEANSGVEQVSLRVWAEDDAKLQVEITPKLVVTGDINATVDGRFGGGLYIGDTAVDPAAGIMTIETNTALTNSSTRGLILQHNTSGTPAASFGNQIHFQLQSSTTEDRDAATINAEWATATDATRMGRMKLYARDAASLREGLRIESDGAQPLVGFLGAAAVARAAHIANPTGGDPAVDVQARTAINAILVVLENLGLVATS